MQPNRRHIYKTVRGHWFKRSPARCLRPSSGLTGTMNGKTAVPVANTQQLKMLGTMSGKTTMPGSRAGTGPNRHHKDGPKGPQSPTRGKCQVGLQQKQRQHQHRLHNFRQFRNPQSLGSRWTFMNTSNTSRWSTDGCTTGPAGCHSSNGCTTGPAECHSSSSKGFGREQD